MIAHRPQSVTTMTANGTATARPKPSVAPLNRPSAPSDEKPARLGTSRKSPASTPVKTLSAVAIVRAEPLVDASISDPLLLGGDYPTRTRPGTQWLVTYALRRILQARRKRGVSYG